MLQVSTTANKSDINFKLRMGSYLAIPSAEDLVFPGFSAFLQLSNSWKEHPKVVGPTRRNNHMGWGELRVRKDKQLKSFLFFKYSFISVRKSLANRVL